MQAVLPMSVSLHPPAADDLAELVTRHQGQVLGAAMRQVATHIGAPIFLPGSLAKTVVHVTLHGVSAKEALEALVDPLGLGWERRSGYVVLPEP